LPIDNIKMLLGITTPEKDSTLNYLNDTAITLVTDYCRRADITPTMSKVIDSIVLRLWRANGYGQESAPQTLSTLTEGTVTMQIKTTQYSSDTCLTDAEKKALQKSRKPWSS
jgi:predicted GTPase